MYNYFNSTFIVLKRWPCEGIVFTSFSTPGFDARVSANTKHKFMFTSKMAGVVTT
jgi:hypothetical protein